MLRRLGWIIASAATIAVCSAANAEGPIIDLKGTWTGKVKRHVTKQGFSSLYSDLKIVVEEQNGKRFKGYLIDNVARENKRVIFKGAVDLYNQYFYLRFTSGDVCIGKIVTEHRILLFDADSDEDTFTVFRLKKAAASPENKP